MKKVFYLFLVLLLVWTIPGCRNIGFYESSATLRVINVGDVGVAIYISTDGDYISDLLGRGQMGVYEYIWEGSGPLPVMLEVEDLNDGEVFVESFDLWDGDLQDWEVGFIYRGSRKTGSSVARKGEE